MTATPDARPAPRRRGRPRKDDPRPRVDAALLDALARLLAQGQSFGTLSVEALCQEAGIARATFYLHYRDKGALVAHWLNQVSDEVVASGGDWFAGQGRPDAEQVRTALHGIVMAFQRHCTVFSAVADTAPFDREVAALHQSMMARLCGASRRAIRCAQAAGVAHPQADDAMADLLTWLVELYCSRFLSGLDEAGLHAMADRLAHVCAQTIFRPDQGAMSKRSRKP